jgi:hypothetical protein
MSEGIDRAEALWLAYSQGGRSMTALAQEVGLSVSRVSRLIASFDGNSKRQDLTQYCSVRQESRLKGTPLTTASCAQFAVRVGWAGQWPEAACSPWGLGLQRFGRETRTASFDA